MERISIKTNDIDRGSGRGIHSESAEYMFLESGKNFQNFKGSSEIYSELPTKRHKGGGLNTIEVPLPLEGETLQYHTITDPPLIEK